MVFKVMADPYISIIDKEKLLYWSKSIFDSIQVGILIVDVETKIIVDINSAAALMIGSRKEDIVGSPCASRCSCLSETGKCPVIDLGMDIENELHVLTRKDGSKLDVLINVTSSILDNRRFLIKSFVDVSSCREDKEDWGEIEKLLSDNIAKTKKTHNNIDKNMSKVKQNLYKALDYSGEDKNE